MCLLSVIVLLCRWLAVSVRLCGPLPAVGSAALKHASQQAAAGAGGICYGSDKVRPT